MLKTNCALCGSELEYTSESAGSTESVEDEQEALTKWLEAHEVCRTAFARDEEE